MIWYVQSRGGGLYYFVISWNIYIKLYKKVSSISYVKLFMCKIIFHFLIFFSAFLWIAACVINPIICFRFIKMMIILNNINIFVMNDFFFKLLVDILMKSIFCGRKLLRNPIWCESTDGRETKIWQQISNKQTVK